MGVDIVEFVMEIEERFEIQLEDDDYAEAVTVGALYEMVLRKRGLPFEPFVWPCPNFGRFARVRDWVVDRFGVRCEDVHPRMPLHTVVQEPGVESAWAQLGDELGIALPRLVRNWGPRWLLRGALGLSGMVGLVALPGATGPAVFVGAGVLFAIVSLLPPPQLAIPEWVTVRTVVRLQSFAEQHIANGTIAEERAAIWNDIKSLLIEHFNLDPEEITPEASFINDLGLD